MKIKTASVFFSVILIVSAAFVFGGCGKKNDGYIVVDGISKTGCKLYSQTKNGVEELAKIDISPLNNEQFSDVNYSLGVDSNSFFIFFNLGGKEYEEYFAVTNYSPNNVQIILDKSYPDLTLEGLMDKYYHNVAQGTLTEEYLKSVAESGHLENILYRCKIVYEDYRSDHSFYCSIESYVFKNKASLQQAADSGLFNNDATFLPFVEGYTYHENVLIKYLPYYVPSGQKIVEPTFSEINKIKVATAAAINTLNNLTKERGK